MSDLALDERGAAEGPQAGRSKRGIGFAVRGLAVCSAYYFGTLLGYALIVPSSYIPIVWPPNTILLVALLLSPWRQWPWLLLIVSPVHALAQAQSGVTFPVAALYYVFDCALLLLTAATLRRFGLGDLALPEDTPPPERRIVVRTHGDGDRWVKVSVSDGGHGIPPDRLPRIFESFYTTKEHGMGLGLAVARSIIEVHGGRVWASNNLGGGATFTVALPPMDDVRAAR